MKKSRKNKSKTRKAKNNIEQNLYEFNKSILKVIFQMEEIEKRLYDLESFRISVYETILNLKNQELTS